MELTCKSCRNGECRLCIVADTNGKRYRAYIKDGEVVSDILHRCEKGMRPVWKRPEKGKKTKKTLDEMRAYHPARPIDKAADALQSILEGGGPAPEQLENLLKYMRTGRPFHLDRILHPKV